VVPENENDGTEAVTEPLGVLAAGPTAGATKPGEHPGNSVAAETQTNNAMTIRHRFIGEISKREY
jgi:hypothetical protein